jgi:hypothetical protein
MKQATIRSERLYGERRLFRWLCEERSLAVV